MAALLLHTVIYEASCHTLSSFKSTPFLEYSFFTAFGGQYAHEIMTSTPNCISFGWTF